jgi:hypothetical protein
MRANALRLGTCLPHVLVSNDKLKEYEIVLLFASMTAFGQRSSHIRP